MEYRELKELKRSEKSLIQLVRKEDTEQIFVRKILEGQHEVYQALQGCPHPYLPKLYEVTVSDEETTVIEEYVEKKLPEAEKLSDQQFRSIVWELCCVLEFLHGKGIIHRDIKPSNILLAGDGHIRLIDFDAARIYKGEKEQDTRLLGTRGYAPPEQYGFAQTDERADIYSLGMTLEQLLQEKADRHGYRRVIRKCTQLDPEKRYQSVRQVRNAFFRRKWYFRWAAAALLAAALVWRMAPLQAELPAKALTENADLQILPTPENPRWDGETGSGMWGNVPESGDGTGNVVRYKCRLFRKDGNGLPPSENDAWEWENEDVSGNTWIDVDGVPTYIYYFSRALDRNGVWYFAVASVGDNITYADSPWVMSDAFVFTGENAPSLPAPKGLAWSMEQTDKGWMYYATWENLEDYADEDSFNVTVYDKDRQCGIWRDSDPAGVPVGKGRRIPFYRRCTVLPAKPV